ncbi:MAG TPA: ATP-dependent 6-phosphofructokinase [Gemmataceae bacterium]|nr:ATP-dependent 6-phosphofructokinase [Gemmataceae bacterium]
MGSPARARCIGILTSGGDCPGLNAAIRGVVKPCLSDFHIEVIGIEKGFRGLVENHARPLHLNDVSNILAAGGTILGTSREKPHKMPLPNGQTVDLTSRAVETYHRLGLDCLVCLGGNGTHKVAYNLMQHGLNVLGLPKTIDNDLVETDTTFGHDSAVATAAEAIDRLHSTAEAHLRVMVIELMGHKAGWLTLAAGLAGGADIILIPEIPYDLDSICQHLTERRRRGKWFSIVAVAEGAVPRRSGKPIAAAVELAAVAAREGKKDKKKSKRDAKDGKAKAGPPPASNGNEAGLDDAGDGRASSLVAKAISRRLGMDTRVTVLGHLQRGGVPTASDRILATRFGTHAAELLAQGKYNRMVCLKGSEVTSVPIELVAGKLKLVPPDHPLLRAARRVGTNFGD